MEVLYEKDEQQSLVVYGETVASLLKEEQFEEKHILLVTNQKYYDLFSDKLIRLFNHRQNLDWYICSNDAHCNNFSELASLLAFIGAFPISKDYMLIGIGNEGVMHLSSFIDRTAPFKINTWQLPLSLQALSKAISGYGLIELNRQKALQSISLAEKIIYDQTMIKKDGDSQLADFMVFIQCGIVCSHNFLRDLFRNFSDKQRLNQQSFNGLLNPLLQFYEKQGNSIQEFGYIFEKAFYAVDGGHLLSNYMKQLLGILLQLLWSQQKNGFSFHFENFLIWLMRLGYPVEFPKQIFTSDYVQELLTCSENFGKSLLLQDIGVPEEKVNFDAEQLLLTVEEYRKLIDKIEKGQ
ncbi:hypothetical protein [Enterococcus sp. CWB-B31]|uniref:hypothetical protein n=1 Tax=Enterococcus sp. CWB-B31 TaxID=2885159 RepID=UPI001E52C8EE|nr:hypothetical protein [Enterococcus sp. CWB-B31]MCB5955680.1 hypothetical protein [Enterococcus sp. CWB-B31]